MTIDKSDDDVAIARSRVRLSRLLLEVFDGLGRRRGRSLLTVLGATLGIGSFVTVLGLTSTANSQVSATFTKQAATEVVVEHSQFASTEFPADAEQRVQKLNGVLATARVWTLQRGDVSRLPRERGDLTQGSSLRVTAASPGFWMIAGAKLDEGRFYDSAISSQPVAVLGRVAAKALGVSNLNDSQFIFVNGRALRVIGLVGSVRSERGVASSVVVPAAFAEQSLQPAGQSDEILVRTRLGAGAQVASEAPTALDAYTPEAFSSVYPPSPVLLSNAVSAQLRSLFLALAGVCMLVGAVGIVNVTMFGMLERIPEIGLRRMLGATPSQIVVHFLAESAVLGAFGGLFGGLLGEFAVIGVAVANSWTASMVPWTFAAAMPAGLVLGLVAGAYPSWRASTIEPAVAFQR